MKQTGKFHVYEIKDDKRVVSAIANATLYFLDVNNQEQFKLTTKTDNEGNFNFDLAIGEYVVLATAGDGLEQVLANGSTFKLTAQSEVNAFEEWLNKPSESVDSLLLAKFRELMQRTETAAEKGEQAAIAVDENLEVNLKKLSDRTDVGLSALTVEKNSSIQEIKDTKDDSLAELKTATDKADGIKQDINNAETSAAASVNSAKTTSLTEINTAKTTSLTEINTAKTTSLTEINTAKTNAVNAVNTTKESGVKAVTDTKTAAISEVNATKDTAIEEIESKVPDFTSELEAKQDKLEFVGSGPTVNAKSLYVPRVIWRGSHGTNSQLNMPEDLKGKLIRIGLKDGYRSYTYISGTEVLRLLFGGGVFLQFKYWESSFIISDWIYTSGYAILEVAIMERS